MKKLNRKGFTLIELLAVIVVLAIVLVVTIPSVISSMNSAKKKQLQNAADVSAEWFTKQYEIDNYDLEGNDIAYTNFVSDFDDLWPVKEKDKYDFQRGVIDELGVAVLEASGISNASKNIDTASSFIWVDGNNRVCIILTAKEGGTFYINDHDAQNFVISKGCE
ncbi:MAG: prepilin-type N-terminal cleavage/methylation domain-containing protein [Bacilli bacterium]